MKIKEKLITIVKYFKPLYAVYYYVLSGVLGILSLLIKTDNKLILFNSFGGKKYDDSPKAIYEKMRKDKRFAGFKFVWAFHEPHKYRLKGAKVIKTDTPEYFLTALKARCWITNSGIERGLKFKGRRTFYLNTWHGTPIKKMGADIDESNRSFGTKGGAQVDIMCSQGNFETAVFSRVFNIPKKRFLECGLPRNDRLANYTTQDKERLRKKLGLPEGKTIILYAPTFREYERDDEKNCVLVPPMDLKKWKDELGDKYCLLFRAHYEVAKIMDIEEDGFTFNMTEYASLEDLMIAADILISDYSSIFFDFSIMDKPMLHFSYDYEKYSENRGMYFDIREKISGADNEDELIRIIKNIDNNVEKNKTKHFKDKYVNYYGSATKAIVDYIADKIMR